MTARNAAPAALALALLLPACGTFERGWSGATDTLTGVATRATPDWGGPRPGRPEASLTVQRVRGNAAATPEAGVLTPEAGNVWPNPEERPRATLANPEEAMRGIPPLREDQQRDRPPVARRGGSTPPEFLGGSPDLQPIPDAPPPPRARVVRPLPPREDGQVIPTPGGPAVTTGGAGNTRTTISPQGPGLAIQQGPTTTLIGPGGQVQVVPTPR